MDYKDYQEWLRQMEDGKKAVNNPDVRRNDPEEWASLSDEQRDVIQQWYTDKLEQQRRREQEVKGRETSECMFGLYFIGAAVGVFEFSRGGHMSDPLLAGIGWLIAEVVSGILVCGIAAAIGKAVGKWAIENGHSRWGRTWRSCVSVAIWALVMGAIFVR